MSGLSEDLFDNSTQFVDLIIPVPIAQRFTYRVPSAWNDRMVVGQRVIVPFGQRKILTGVVASIHNHPPAGYEAKYVLEVLDEAEIITAFQFRLYEWMAAYYLCTPGEVLNAALPSGLKLSSESIIQINPAFNPEETEFDFSEKERMLINHLLKGPLSYSEAAKILEVRSVYSLLKSLSSKDVIVLLEKVKEKFKPKTEKRFRLAKAYANKEALEALFETLAGKPLQEAVVLRYLQVVPVFQDPAVNERGLTRAVLLEGDISESSLQTLTTKGIFESFETVVPRFGFEDPVVQAPLLLTPRQEETRNSILHAFSEQGSALIHGITGSGKTEIYIDLIRRVLDGGSQVLYLLPEIALTTQIVHRLKKVFGAQMGVYHSKFSDNERVEVWNGVLEGKFRFVVGVRSSVFLPFDNLGLIIVDEEHDPSYKQQDPSPRYHAKDVALMMAQHHHAKVLLGSATPSCESYYLTKTGKMALVSLKERFGEAKLPSIVFANLSRERRQKSMKGEFSSVLLKEIGNSLSSKNQSIIFQNRRGHSPLVQCEDCTWVPKCINCAVSLTYHQYRHAVVCHYCGYREELPSQCPTCSSKRILTLGYGTEKLEEELKLHFPEASVGRMDLDTTRSRSGYESIISDFEQGQTDILVGTQMVTKGLDFDKVNLVGIFDADRMMHYPDFRSYERAFQLIIQVSGRAGRRDQPGLVVIQTSNPDHPLFAYVKQHDVSGFLETQLSDRELHQFPPYARLVEVTVKHTDRTKSQRAAQAFADALRKKAGANRVLGPGQPMISRIRNEFLHNVLLKIPRHQGNLEEIKGYLVSLADRIKTEKEFRTVKIVFDVDPV